MSELNADTVRPPWWEYDPTWRPAPAEPAPASESVAPWKTGDLVTDPETGMVGKVADWWLDDGGQWINVEWFPSTVRADEVVEPSPEDRRTHES